MATPQPSTWVIISKLKSGQSVYWNIPSQNWTRLPEYASTFPHSALAHEEARHAQFQAVGPVTVEPIPG